MPTKRDQAMNRNAGMTRRDLVLRGGLGLGAIPLANQLAANDLMAIGAPKTSSPNQMSPSFGCAKSVILFWLNGGPAQQESWDPKPSAPVEVRGPYSPIATRTPGLNVCELMPRTANLTDKIAVLRAVVTNDNAHSSSGYAMLTGIPHQPLNA